ncbi:MAG: hypothetical protein ACC631_09885 [Halocynthiibacter sp.]
MRSRFLEWYYERNRRPGRDHLVALLERMMPKLSRIAGLVNAVQSLGVTRAVVARYLGMVDLPKLSTDRLVPALKRMNLRPMSCAEILSLDASERDRLVVLIQDVFTSCYDTRAVLSQVALVQELGYRPVVLAYQESGKPLHVQGFLKRFDRIAGRNAANLADLASAGLRLVGVEISTTLIYRHEYQSVNKNLAPYTVQLLSEWLAGIALPKLSCPVRYRSSGNDRAMAFDFSRRWSGYGYYPDGLLRCVRAVWP